MKKTYFFLITILFSTASFSQSIVLLDEFDGTTQYSSSGEYVTSPTQYFGMTTKAYADMELGYGDFPFFGARQLSTSPATITLDDLVITGLTNLSLAIGIAEDKGTGSSEDWDAGDSVLIEYSLNNGSWITLFSIEVTGTDNAPEIISADSNNGTLITSDIEEF
ncbi:MAG: hypothetical protein ACJA1H_002305 [Glaciecola sp.]|jgi:hypothetical protein